MEVIILDTYEAVCKKMADDLLQITTAKTPLVCPASGDTPKGLYQELVVRVMANKADLHNWNFIGLDEWMHMNGEDEGSCRNYLDKDLFIPLQTDEKNIFFFDGKAPDASEECRKAELFIEANNGIEVAILGLGTNGHIAMNEPGTPKNSRSHISSISKETQEVGQKYFKNPTPITQGLTLGIGTLLEARNIMLMVTGKKKASIIQKILSSPVTEEIPATLFLDHPSITLYLDKEAASLLPPKK